MKVSKAIQILQEFSNHDEEVVIVWWDRNCFSYGSTDELPTVEQWKEAVERFDDRDGFSEYVSSQCHDEVMEYVHDVKEKQTA